MQFLWKYGGLKVCSATIHLLGITDRQRIHTYIHNSYLNIPYRDAYLGGKTTTSARAVPLSSAPGVGQVSTVYMDGSG